MLTIDKSTREDKVSYYWDNEQQRFGFGNPYMNHGFKTTHEIVVDNGLTALQIDAIMSDVFEVLNYA